MNNSIIKETCKKCHLCIEICPAKTINSDADGTACFIQSKIHTCLQCGQCMAICQSNSIFIESLSYEKNIFELQENKVDYQELFTFLSHRRSVRNFKNKPVESEKIQKIIDILSLSPYGAIHDSVQITIINNRQTIEKALPLISKFYDNVENWLHNPIMRYFIKKEAGIEQYNTIKHHLLPRIEINHYKYPESGDNITRNAPTLMIFHSDLSLEEHTEDANIWLVYSFLAAQSLGLGATIIGLIGPAVNKTKELKQYFKIPEKHEVVTSLILGYPKYHFTKSIKRPKTKINWLE